jgi:guanylate kinase
MRLRNRSQAEHMTIEAVIERRLREAREELKHLPSYRYALVNDVLDRAVTELRAIVFSARVVQQHFTTGEALAEFTTSASEDPNLASIADGCLTSQPSARLKDALGSFDQP